MRNVGARPERELEAGLQVEEDDSAMLELLADDALRGQAEAVAVEDERPLQVVDAEGNEGDARFHRKVCNVPKPTTYSARRQRGTSRATLAS